MERTAPGITGFILPPALVAAMVWFLCLSVGALWMLASFRWPEEGDPGARMLSGWQYAGLSAVHALLLVALVASWVRSAERHLALRRGHRAGLALGLVTLAVAQVLVHLAFGIRAATS